MAHINVPASKVVALCQAAVSYEDQAILNYEKARRDRDVAERARISAMHPLRRFFHSSDVFDIDPDDIQDQANLLHHRERKRSIQKIARLACLAAEAGHQVTLTEADVALLRA